MIIDCTIKTPQHKHGKVFDYTVQRGRLSTVTWVFEPVQHISGSVGMHQVVFENEKDFEKFKVE